MHRIASLASLVFLVACGAESSDLLGPPVDWQGEAGQGEAGQGEAGQSEVPTEAEAGPAMPRAVLDLTLDSDLDWGLNALFTVHGAAPGETVHLLGSTAGEGAGPCYAIIGGQCVDLLPTVRQVGSSVADAAGEALFVVTLPATGPAPTLDISLQAVAIRGGGGALSVLSDPATFTVGAAAGGGAIVEDHPFVAAKADVLFLVDNSCSMFDEQNALAASFPAMLTTLQTSGLDWQAGVISTDMQDPTHKGKLREVAGLRWVDANTVNPEQTFSAMAAMGTAGSGQEQGLDAIAAALDFHAAGYNAGFDRGDSQLATIALSDEDDFSTISTVDFELSYGGLRADPADLSFHAIVTPIGGCPTGASEGLRYLDAVATFGGLDWSICAAGYDTLLTDVVDSLWSSQPMVLGQVPDPATLQVEAEEPGPVFRVLAASEWSYDAVENSVTIDPSYRPPSGTVFHISYDL